MYLQGALWRKNAQKIIGFLNALASDWSGKKIVVAFSGGADSLFLLLALRELQKKYGYILLPVHIHHGILAEDDLYASLAELAADKVGLTCAVLRAKVDPGRGNLEERMRIERYRLLEEFRQRQQVDYIAVAHHAEDQAETVIANIFRGCGLDGLVGMAEVNASIFRPLLKVSKKEILAMILQTKYFYYEDKLNYVKDCRRNQIRNKLLPLIKKATAVSPTESLLALSENMSELRDFIKAEEVEIEKRIALSEEEKNVFSFSRMEFLKLPVFWRRKMVRKFFDLGIKKVPSRKDVLKIDAWIESGQQPRLKFKEICWERTKNKKVTLSC